MKLVLIGAGQRGMGYATFAHENRRADIVAVAEPHAGRRAATAHAFGLREDACFTSAEALFAQGKLADAAIIASMDRDHYQQAMDALDLGYHLLLEKPISPNAEECLRIQAKANQVHRQVIVCHVLRYAPFFRALKAIVDSKELGRVITIQHNENVGNYHIAHSFVRGNWRNSDLSSPIIVQKSCHDMDLLVWLADSEADKVSSFGDLTFFKKENAPPASTPRCLDCPIAKDCRFDARKCYLSTMGDWPATVLTLDQTEAGILTALREGPYGRCVFQCDNNVCDHQVTQILFQNGITASFVLSGFTNKMCRTMKIMCEHGEIRANEDLNVIEIIPFTSSGIAQVNKRVIEPQEINGSHGGGDTGLMLDFLDMLDHPEHMLASSIERSVESHVIACAAEESRISGQTVHCNAFKASLL